MKATSILLLCFVMALTAAAQTQGKSGDNPQRPAGATKPALDISGMYSFLQDGEFVQVTVEDQGRVTGFISRYGELDSDKGAFLDQFIKQGKLESDSLSFSSEPLHGIWYEFRGTAGRGPGKTPADEGYYVLKGKLIEHITDANHKESARSREVVFKSFPQDVAPAPAKRD